MKVYFTYIDWTTEDVSRPFYVGKGTMKRVRERERNSYWKNIAAKHGWRREIILGTKDESFAFEEEKRYISELGTFENGTPGRWGANLTEGGEGISGIVRSEQTRQKISQAISGHKHYNYGKSLSRETRARISFNRKGISPSSEHRQKLSIRMSGEDNPMRGKKHTEEAKAKMRNASRKVVLKKLTLEIIEEIRLSSESHATLAHMFGVSRQTIKNIRRKQRPNVSNEVSHG